MFWKIKICLVCVCVKKLKVDDWEIDVLNWGK